MTRRKGVSSEIFGFQKQKRGRERFLDVRIAGDLEDKRRRSGRRERQTEKEIETEKGTETEVGTGAGRFRDLVA